jgi:RNA polymerase sigma-70 factor (ECF subfamily)
MVTEADRRIDEYLVVCARLGDRQAFGRLAVRWQKKLLVHAWRLLGDEDGALDAVQEAWGEIVRGIGRLQDETAFPTWAFRIVTRRCAKQIGRRQRRRRLKDAVENEGAAQVPAGGGSDFAEGDFERVRREVRALPAQQQAAVALYYFEELTVAEVAVALDAPAGTIKTRLLHARERLRQALLGDEP